MRRPFQQHGPSIQINLTTAASVAVPLSTLTTAGTNAGIESAQFYNQSTNDAYLWIGVSTATASSVTTASGFSGLPVPFRQRVVYSVPPNAWVSGLTTAATLTAGIVITPGSGGI